MTGGRDGIGSPVAGRTPAEIGARTSVPSNFASSGESRSTWIAVVAAVCLALIALGVGVAVARVALERASRPVRATGIALPSEATAPKSVASAGGAGTGATAQRPAGGQPPAVSPRKVTASTAASAPAARTTPERMASLLPGSQQLIVVTGARLGSNSGTLELYNLEGSRWVKVLGTHANFGKNGLIDGVKRRQGHLQTPTGIWWAGEFVFGQHPSAPAGTRMPYRPINSNSWWSSEPNGTYNTWVQSSAAVSGEHLADSKVQYEYAINSGYNATPNQRVIGRGTAIFLHIFEPSGNALGPYTHGCVAISRAAMLKLIALLDPARKPSVAIGTLMPHTPTSIWSY